MIAVVVILVILMSMLAVVNIIYNEDNIISNDLNLRSNWKTEMIE